MEGEDKGWRGIEEGGKEGRKEGRKGKWVSGILEI